MASSARDTDVPFRATWLTETISCSPSALLDFRAAVKDWSFQSSSFQPCALFSIKNRAVSATRAGCGLTPTAGSSSLLGFLAVECLSSENAPAAFETGRKKPTAVTLDVTDHQRGYSGAVHLPPVLRAVKAFKVRLFAAPNTHSQLRLMLFAGRT